MDKEFEQNYYYKTAKGIYRNGYDSIRLSKRIAYYQNINYFDLMASVLSALNETSER